MPLNELDHDVIVIGGGAAGLSAAVTLARSRRRVLVVDAGQPRNAPAAGVHNLLGLEDISPHELLVRGRAEVTGYGGEIRTGTVESAAPIDGGFQVVLADGSRATSRRLIVTTGLVDELPDVPGLAERWGRDVLHCPYCHGWEVRDQELVVLATGPAGVHQALLFSQLSDRVSLLLHGQAPPDEATQRTLGARGVRLVEGVASEVLVTDDAIRGIRLEDGSTVPCQAVVVGPRFAARSAVLESLGLVSQDFLMGEHVVGSHIAAEPTGQTELPGVFVAGNVTDPGAQVGMAAAQGVRVAAWVNMVLIEEDAALALSRLGSGDA
ncbi:FAD-dependent pyridine nucleotide-disulfide oxidoreductase [metagenome]|uniref:FAD-dependent pyridine nucleotide-disulfide oxidoreductase n=1 Tax=metagenome TaxID=256318 RepID=A0A2P2C7C2_9ZZZZ